MRLTFLGKNSAGGDSPTLYATDRDTYVVQGWRLPDADLAPTLAVPSDMECVEIPPQLLNHLANDGVTVGSISPRQPIVHVTGDGNYVIQGLPVLDPDALAQMRIPAHESCVEIDKSAVRALVEEPERGTGTQ